MGNCGRPHHDAVVEAGDHHAATHGEGDGLVALAGGIERLSIIEGADVVDGNLVALLDSLRLMEEKRHEW